MNVLRVEAAMLRALMPDLVLREGMRVVASVAERVGQRGIIVLAGTPLAAQLPDNVRVGDVLRLIVSETSSERVVLRIADAQQAAQTPPPSIAVPLPGGANAHITVAERDASEGRGDGEQQEVRLTYASARLGSIDLHLAMAGDHAVRVSVRARAGAPFELAERHARELQEALASATGKPAQVIVSPRHDPFETYA
jgi:hypothetical protein